MKSNFYVTSGIKRLLIFFMTVHTFSFPLIGQMETYSQAISGTDVTIEFIKIPEGAYQVAKNSDDNKINVPSFWMSTFEITDDQYQVFRDKTLDSNESGWSDDYNVDAITRPTPPYLDFTYGMGNTGGFPAVSMTQQAALRYCKWLYQKTGKFFRLPTELEWEYACWGGKTEQDLPIEDYAWYWDNSSEKYHKVGSKKANGYGLYDMLGNVSEYTSDQYTEDLSISAEQADYPGLSLLKGKYGRVVKGGAYDDDEESCNCSYRIPSNPAWQARDPQIPKSIWWNPDSPFVGFRIVRPEGEFTKEEVESYFNWMIVD